MPTRFGAWSSRSTLLPAQTAVTTRECAYQLRKSGQGFATHLRAVDLICRIGGDEFAAALPDTSTDTAREALERLRTSLPSSATCSVGLALWDGSESPDHLVQRADDALYRAKAEGRDRLIVA